MSFGGESGLRKVGLGGIHPLTQRYSSIIFIERKVLSMSIFSVNHKQPLFRNSLFWLSILLPLFLGVFLGFFIWIDYSLSFTSLGYSNFLNISKLPLGVMSLAFPISGVFIVHYTSKQKSEILYTSEVDKLEGLLKKSNEIKQLLKRLSRVRNFFMFYIRNSNKIQVNLNVKIEENVYKHWCSVYDEVLSLDYLHDIEEFEKIDASMLGFVSVAEVVKVDNGFSEVHKINADFDLLECRLLALWHYYQIQYIGQKNDLCKLYGLFEKINEEEYNDNLSKYNSYLNDYNDKK